MRVKASGKVVSVKLRERVKISQTAWDEIGEANGPVLVAANVANGRRIDGEHGL
jgi:hypothetical protein